jgi:hypothetical protein
MLPLLGQLLGAASIVAVAAIHLPPPPPAWPIVDPADPSRLILNHRPDRRRGPARVVVCNEDLRPYAAATAAALRGECGGCVLVLVRISPQDGAEGFEPDGSGGFWIETREFCEFWAGQFPGMDVVIVAFDPF